MSRPGGTVETEGRHIIYKDRGCKFYPIKCKECPYDFCLEESKGRLWLELNKHKVSLILKGLGKTDEEITKLIRGAGRPERR